jgi:hypothetical protein
LVNRLTQQPLLLFLIASRILEASIIEKILKEHVSLLINLTMQFYEAGDRAYRENGFEPLLSGLLAQKQQCYNIFYVLFEGLQ